jgi:hypothetical protein
MSKSLIPSGESEASLASPALEERLEQQVFAPARAAGFEELAVATVTDPPPPIETKRSPDGKWWVASTFELDPVMVANGGVMEAPEEVVTELRDMRSAGIDFDQVWVLSELPAEWTPGTPPPKMRLAGGDTQAGQVVRNQETVFAAALEALRLTAQAVGMAVKGTAVVGGAAIGAAGAATVGVAGAAFGVGASMGLDPVILGGVEDPESGKIAWVPIAAWLEQPDE